jgi:hypothetical protein
VRISTHRNDHGNTDGKARCGSCSPFAKRENQIDSIWRTIAWFDKYLKNE